MGKRGPCNGPGTVLLVEDDAAGRAMLELALRRQGFKVFCAAGGFEALLILSREACDWLVTDARMRPMTGLELACRAKELRPSLRIMIVSAETGDQDPRCCPIECFLTKPFAVEDLVHRLAAPAP